VTENPRKVLLVEPVLFGHSLLYIRAALASSGFEQTQFTAVTLVPNDTERLRVLELARTEPRLNVRILGVLDRPCLTRWDFWRAFARAMRGVERMLRAESFDLVTYLYLDLALVFFAVPVFRPLLRAHHRCGLTGLVFRDNGLRLPASRSLKARFRSGVDRWLLLRALRNGPFRKVAFLDPWCAERARQLVPSVNCGKGVDPVFWQPCDAEQARSRLGIKAQDFVILFFGTMSHRKYLVESLALLCQAPLPADGTVIVVAGPSFPQHRDSMLEQLAATSRKYRVIHHERFINDSELPPYFAAADCVMCVYRDFTGSSSVLLHAAIYGKPALVSPGGAMEDAVRQYNFGEVATVTDPNGFLGAVCRIAALTPPEREALAGRALAYGRTMDARRFMSQFEG
jgi:glycosyltransferase involved in cell wall biosynthesis